jgi:hypothetical protein
MLDRNHYKYIVINKYVRRNLLIRSALYLSEKVPITVFGLSLFIQIEKVKIICITNRTNKC